MTPRRAVPAVAVVLLALLGAWLLFVALPRWMQRTEEVSGSAPATATAAPGAERRITATLYYISEDGLSLVGVQREVPFEEPVAAQARRIVEAQVGAAPPPLASAVPEGTTVRGLYLTERGDAFVDLSDEARVAHRGGALEELFTVYALVNAVTVNLPAIARVQILVNGQEVDTLAGHVDLRHPLERNLAWVRGEDEQDAPDAEQDKDER